MASQEKIQVDVGYGKASNFTTLIWIPSSIDGTRYVCFHAVDDPDGEMCRYVQFRAKGYQKVVPNVGLHEEQGMLVPGLNDEQKNTWLTSLLGDFGKSSDIEFLESVRVWIMFLVNCVVVIVSAMVFLLISCCMLKLVCWIVW
ncbi:hypothetical protein NECAME_02892 [Necator americanus]|nr:hypothetical protein NECAME_02892 [Necator americanus]ETN78455.1 hypothetical protein NECAME_02892 [Necator americanus]